ncbi:protein-tyrosine phosphatase family protein [Caldivirga sp.]|uniref:protein-tyrosine phosphatase family protein n=1 Tax=Caldivirga sp. TaxID=2080243 RepID=UPI003D096258
MNCPYWVIKGKLAGSCAPRGTKDLETWSKIGIRAVVSLIEEFEFNELGFPFNNYVEALRRLNIRLLYSPTKDGESPPLDEFMAILKWIDERVSENEPVLVHCNAGVGRSPTVIIGYLMFKGYSLKEAYRLVSSVNDKVSLSFTQALALEELEKLTRGERNLAL